jgi:hypothetical protein
MLQAQLLAEGVCYTSLLNRRTVLLWLLQASYRLFEGATVVRHLDALAPYIRALRTGLDDDSRSALFDLTTAFDPAVLDAVRIATCFENLYKARLLHKGFVVHRINEKVPGCAHLAQAQCKRPIHVLEIKRAEGLGRRRDLAYAFRSLSPRTVDRTTFAKRAYKEALRLPDRLYECVEHVAAQRNAVHFLVADMAQYNESVIADLQYMRAACNRYVVAHANRLLDRFGFPAARHLATLG